MISGAEAIGLSALGLYNSPRMASSPKKGVVKDAVHGLRMFQAEGTKEGTRSNITWYH